jgi:hypothetical protein
VQRQRRALCCLAAGARAPDPGGAGRQPPTWPSSPGSPSSSRGLMYTSCAVARCTAPSGMSTSTSLARAAPPATAPAACGERRAAWRERRAAGPGLLWASGRVPASALARTQYAPASSRPASRAPSAPGPSSCASSRARRPPPPPPPRRCCCSRRLAPWPPGPRRRQRSPRAPPPRLPSGPRRPPPPCRQCPGPPWPGRRRCWRRQRPGPRCPWLRRQRRPWWHLQAGHGRTKGQQVGPALLALCCPDHGELQATAQQPSSLHCRPTHLRHWSPSQQPPWPARRCRRPWRRQRPPRLRPWRRRWPRRRWPAWRRCPPRRARQRWPCCCPAAPPAPAPAEIGRWPGRRVDNGWQLPRCMHTADRAGLRAGLLRSFFKAAASMQASQCPPPFARAPGACRWWIPALAPAPAGGRQAPGPRWARLWPS